MRLWAVLATTAIVSAAIAQNRVGAAPEYQLRVHKKQVSHLDFSADGKTLISSGEEPFVLVWDFHAQKVDRKVAPVGRAYTGAETAVGVTLRRIEGIAFNADGSQFAETTSETSSSGTARIWNTADGEQVRVLSDALRNTRAVTWSPDGKWIAVNTRLPDKPDDKILVFDAATGKLAFELFDTRLVATALEFSPDSAMLASAGTKQLLLWDISTKKIAKTITGFDKPITAISFRGDSKAIATVAGDVLRIWGTDDGKQIREIACEQEGVAAVDFSPSGKAIATAGNNRTAKLWNPETGRLTQALVAHVDKVTAVSFNHDGTFLATADREGQINVWKIEEEKLKDQKDDPTKKPKDPRKQG